MSGVVKGIKKVFKKVVKFVKKALPIVLMAVAVYFTAGLALSAMPATASFAASMPGFAGGGFLGLGVGTSITTGAAATAGTGIFSQAAVAMGVGTLGAHGGLVGGALAAGTSTAQLAAAGMGTGAIVTGATEAAAAGLTPGIASGTATLAAGGTAETAAGVIAGGGVGGTMSPAAQSGAAQSVLQGGAKSAGQTVVQKGAEEGAKKAGMTLGEKMLLASTGLQAVAALSTPSPEEEARFKGAYYGMERSGAGSAVMPGPVTPQGPPTGKPAVPGVAPVELFEQGPQLATSVPQRGGNKFDVGPQGPDLFQPMAGVRYI